MQRIAELEKALSESKTKETHWLTECQKDRAQLFKLSLDYARAEHAGDTIRAILAEDKLAAIKNVVEGPKLTMDVKCYVANEDTTAQFMAEHKGKEWKVSTIQHPAAARTA